LARCGFGAWGEGNMRELMRTNDPVLLSWLTSLLSDAGIESIVFDGYTSVMEGSIAAIQRRLMVDDDDFEPARRLLGEAGHPLEDA
jgi:hypothetical protein